MYSLIPQVTIIAVAVDTYDDRSLRRLYGPVEDVRMLKRLLVENRATALYPPNQFIEKVNPNAEDLRILFNNYVYERSADGDILIFYFSGHGVAIGRDDFGFCTTDSIIHPVAGVTLPLSVVKLSEILNSINIANVIPIFIIDACYSGLTGKRSIIPPVDMITGMHNHIHSIAASSYAFFCSCSENQTALGSYAGGVFSQALVDVASQGILNKEPTLTFISLYTVLFNRVFRTAGDNTPRLYLGSTVPKFPFVINTKFVFRRYSLSPGFVKILEVLWDDGQDRELDPNEIGELCGHSDYCNHNKLSFAPWKLVETVPNTLRRRLSDRGRQFILGELIVPKTLKQDPRTGEVVPVDGARFVRYSDYQ